MSLKGNIETLYLASLLQLLCGDKKTGVLTISEADRKVQVYLKQGSIVYAVGTQKEVRLGYLLRTKGIISAEELQTALTLAKERRERLGKILVERGFISVETLKRFIHQQVREVLYDLFLWKRGEFEYVDQEIKLEPDFITEFNPMEIILEGTRRVDEWDILRKQIPHPQIVFRISKDVQNQKDSINLNANEWRIISLVDGKRTVQQIIGDSGHEEYAVYRIMNSLISSGLIERVATTAPAIGGEELEAAAVIKVYHDVLLNLGKLLAKAAGPGAGPLLTQAKAQVPAESRALLHGHDFTKSAKANIKGILEGRGENPPRKEELIIAFNGLILAILHKSRETLGSEDMVNSYQSLTTMLGQWQAQPEATEIQRTVLTTIGQTLQQFSQEASKEAGAKDKGGAGILSFFKRK